MQRILFTDIFNDAEIVEHAINNTLYEVIKMLQRNCCYFE